MYVDAVNTKENTYIKGCSGFILTEIVQLNCVMYKYTLECKINFNNIISWKLFFYFSKLTTNHRSKCTENHREEYKEKQWKSIFHFSIDFFLL